ncbi:MAG: hypothetical protein ACI4EX_14340 [Lachnospiraceae bacterium]
MAKKSKNQPSEKKDAGSYYKINKDAVGRLVNASAETSPKVSDEEIAKVSGRKKHRIPNPVKVLFIKWWFNGAICFFFYFGFGGIIKDQLDLLFIFGAALGMLTDLLTNNALKFLESSPRSNDKYMFVTVRKFWSIFLNLVYGYVCLYFVVYIYGIINFVLNRIGGSENEQILPVGPILFGVFYLIVDMIFILIKNTFKKIIEDAKTNSRR